MKTKILGISGSLRRASFNTALLRAAARCMGGAADFELADLRTLPHYDADIDGEEKPAGVAKLIGQVRSASALLIATPEYNYSVPGVLKNAIDWVSRPAYRSPLAHKPTAILGASMSPIGSARAQSHLRQILGGTVTPLFPYPDFLAGAVHTKVDAEGALVHEATREHLAKFVAAFLEWIE